MMVREPANCAGPEDVRRLLRGQVAMPPRSEAVANQREYIELQEAASAFYRRIDKDDDAGERALKKQLAKLPPCARCPVDVFHYCDATGTECKLFRLYASGN